MLHNYIQLMHLFFAQDILLCRDVWSVETMKMLFRYTHRKQVDINKSKSCTDSAEGMSKMFHNRMRQTISFNKV